VRAKSPAVPTLVEHTRTKKKSSTGDDKHSLSSTAPHAIRTADPRAPTAERTPGSNSAEVGADLTRCDPVQSRRAEVAGHTFHEPASSHHSADSHRIEPPLSPFQAAGRHFTQRCALYISLLPPQ
jgi:hypothetical protein